MLHLEGVQESSNEEELNSKISVSNSSKSRIVEYEERKSPGLGHKKGLNLVWIPDCIVKGNDVKVDKFADQKPKDKQI